MAARSQFHISLYAVLYVIVVVWLATAAANPSVITTTQSSTNATTVKVSTDKPAHAGHGHSYTARGNDTAGGMSFGDLVTNRDALLRSMYVFGALCVMTMLYFAFRAFRLRRRRARRTGTRKYRPLNTGNGHEMEPLDVAGDNDDEDEDTLFDSNQPPSQQN